MMNVTIAQNCFGQWVILCDQDTSDGCIVFGWTGSRFARVHADTLLSDEYQISNFDSRGDAATEAEARGFTIIVE